MSRTQLLFVLMTFLLIGIIVLGMAAGGTVWKLACPAILIALGAVVLVRYFLAPEEGPWEFKLLGDVHLSGSALASDREIWLGIGNIRLDLGDSELPPGETNYRLLGLVGDIEVRVPPDIGLSLDASGLINEIKIFNEKLGGILAPVHYTTDNFESTERRVRIDAAHLVGDLKVRRASA